MKQRLYNLRLVLSHTPSLVSGIVFAGVLWFVMEHFSDRALIIGNFWQTYATINLSFDIINILCIGLFFASFVYKRQLFWEKKDSKSWRLWSILSIIVSGCPACSITLATYLWLASFFAILPYNGLEIKIIATLILLWSVYTNIKNLTTCKRK